MVQGGLDTITSMFSNERSSAMKKSPRLPLQAGIALGPILFIIALLAILAAAIAAGSGSFTSGTTQENAKLMASAIVQQAVTLDNSVSVVRGHGYADTQISFAVKPNLFTVLGGDFGQSLPLDPSLCNSPSCMVFNPAGGGATPALLPLEAVDKNLLDTTGIASGYRAPQVWLVQFLIEGAAPPLHMAYFPYPPLTKEVCMDINTLVGVPNPSGDAPIEYDVLYYQGDINGNWWGFDPNYYYQSYGYVYIFPATDTFTRAKDFCYNTGWGYSYIHVF